MSGEFGTRKTILLVEDNVDDERITLRALRRVNVMNEVVVACDGAEALQMFQSGSVRPDLIILDLHMHGPNGFDVLSHIRGNQKFKSTPVVVFTASESGADVEKAYGLGANSFIQKPSSVAEYEETMLQLAMYWLLLNRSAEAVLA